VTETETTVKPTTVTGAKTLAAGGKGFTNSPCVGNGNTSRYTCRYNYNVLTA